AELTLTELLKERLVPRVLATGILQGPGHLATALGERKRRVRAWRDALMDHGKTLCSRLLQGGEGLLEGLGQERQPRLRQQPVFLLPVPVVAQLILATPTARALPAEDITRFQAVAQKPRDPNL